ncbi:MAG TPA: hypothetical protein VF487_11765 [Chitinophagaceae bacterium]
MPIPAKYLADFDEHGIYHIYNRTNNQEKLFLSDENRYFFLKRYKEYLSLYLDTFCWCLLPNHFHFLIRVISLKDITAAIQNKPFSDRSLTEKRFLEKEITLSELIEQGFKRFFQSYSLAFNKMYTRKGNLFYKPFKRVAIDKQSHFTQAIIYIHASPVKHGICKDFTTYEWSSWRSLLSGRETNLLRDEVLNWFGDKARFINAHQEMIEYYIESDISIED